MTRNFTIVYKPLWFLFVFFLFFSAIAPLHAQYASVQFKPFTFMRVIRTEHFEIIFPKESEPSARLLAFYADDIYKEITSTLGIEVPGRRIPVTFTPHTDRFNAYYSSLSRPHIVLFDTPMDIEWTTYEDSLKYVFIHELVHAISLNTRDSGFRFLHRIFGNWATPTLITAPAFMVEGVTISFESQGGFGRANDPRIKQYLRQAIYEDEFLTPFQASHAFDAPINNSGYWYDYGGLFSFWLQETYGMEKYAQLWQSMGSVFPFSFSVYRSGFYRGFNFVYGIPFLDAWNAFKDSLDLGNLEENNDEVLPVEYRFFLENNRFIADSTLTSNGKNLYFFDQTEKKIQIFDTETERMQGFYSDNLSYDIDVSKDGSVMLVSGYDYFGERAFASVTEHRTASGRKTGRSFRGLYKAKYFRDGVVGIRSELHNNCIVYENFNGNSEVLFRGNQGLVFSGPQVIDNERIAFITARSGVRELWLYNYETKNLYRIENVSGENDYWLYMRNLSVSEGKLFFSHNSDDQMYKLGMIDLETMQAVFSEKNFSGGVFDPVSMNGEIYYRGSFFSRDRILRFPETVDSLSGSKTNIRLIALDTQTYTERKEPENIFAGSSKMYNSLLYMNPFHYWFPLILLRNSTADDDVFSVSVDGGGIMSLIMDPADRNFLLIQAYADMRYQMALIEAINWENTTLGFPLTLGFSDKVIESSSSGPYRATTTILLGNFMWNKGQWMNGFGLGGGYNINAHQEGDKGAYEWEKTENFFYAYGALVFSNNWFMFNLNGISFVDIPEPRLDGLLSFYSSTRFPLYVTFFGIYDGRGMDLHGVSNSYGDSSVDQYILKEYSSTKGLELEWLGGSELAIDLFSFEIQGNASHLYFNRFTGTMMLRNQIYDSKGWANVQGTEFYDFRLLQSLAVKLALQATIFPIVKYPARFEPYIFGAWKISNTITGAGNDFYLTFGFNTSL